MEGTHDSPVSLGYSRFRFMKSSWPKRECQAAQDPSVDFKLDFLGQKEVKNAILTLRTSLEARGCGYLFAMSLICIEQKTNNNNQEKLIGFFFFLCFQKAVLNSVQHVAFKSLFYYSKPYN